MHGALVGSFNGETVGVSSEKKDELCHCTTWRIDALKGHCGWSVVITAQVTLFSCLFFAFAANYAALKGPILSNIHLTDVFCQ